MGCNNVLGTEERRHDDVLGILSGCGNGFLLLVLLFILLASNVTRGRENNFFFIIILAIIAFGGFRRTFGFDE
jgi:hypothetical protein